MLYPQTLVEEFFGSLSGLDQLSPIELDIDPSGEKLESQTGLSVFVVFYYQEESVDLAFDQSFTSSKVKVIGTKGDKDKEEYPPSRDSTFWLVFHSTNLFIFVQSISIRSLIKARGRVVPV